MSTRRDCKEGGMQCVLPRWNVFVVVISNPWHLWMCWRPVLVGCEPMVDGNGKENGIAFNDDEWIE